MNDQLHFNISTGLKRVIGRELITDDEVAIFELVKNSFDANSTLVQICFENDSIFIVDDGDGMTFDDIQNKWLFVAYSSKRDAKASSDDFRQQISDRKYFAGSKGIGRFSSDRLGKYLEMQTRSHSESKGFVHRVQVNWTLFEADETKQFGTIPVSYDAKTDFRIPEGLIKPSHGTAIEIRQSRATWDRSRILHLKSSLAKLINPFGETIDGFKIKIIAPAETIEDEKNIVSSKENDEDLPQNKVVNGDVGNFIFSTLREKTTFLEVKLEEGGLHLVSSLTDRGELIYKIREPNPYSELVHSGFQCQIYYLNQSAKATFTRRMGLESVKFGSVFVFRNGFRVFPIGEEGDDWFQIDRRKQQGYARFLGSRDIIGRIDVSGPEEQFKEASSRNQGLIETEAVEQLKLFFRNYCLIRLERYIVPVSWADKGEKSTDDLSRLLTDSGRARIAGAVAKLIDSSDVEVIEYSRRLIGILNERSGQFEESLISLRAIAEKTKDKKLFDKIEQAEKRFEQLKAAETEAIRIAEEERKAKEAAQQQASEATTTTLRITETLEEEKKRNLFLTSITSLDTETILNMHHQITIYAGDLKQQVENFLTHARKNTLTTNDITSRLEQISFLNQKILSISRLATKANFRLESDKIEADIAEYIEQYILSEAIPLLGSNINIKVQNEGSGLIKQFRPMEIPIVIDNLISNSRKARASEIIFRITLLDKNTIQIRISDDGDGLPENLEDLENLFELGFSRTSGSGLGLYHVRQILGEMGGSISVMNSEPSGASFIIRITS